MKALLTAISLIAIAACALAEPAPTEFVTQLLEPTGGKISRPKDWFHAGRHRGPVYDWMISRGDTKGGRGPYTTGVRIQTFTGVKEGTGKSAKQFILDFIAAKKKEAIRVIDTCEPREQYLFTRVCLETEEGPHRILYSLFLGHQRPRYCRHLHRRHHQRTLADLRSDFQQDGRVCANRHEALLEMTATPNDHG